MIDGERRSCILTTPERDGERLRLRCARDQGTEDPARATELARTLERVEARLVRVERSLERLSAVAPPCPEAPGEVTFDSRFAVASGGSAAQVQTPADPGFDTRFP
jgi:hypothetical protein